jgi:hypothetical protein
MRRAVVVGALGGIAACGEAQGPARFSAMPAAYLLAIDQLREAGFQAVDPPGPISAAAFSGDGSRGSEATREGLDAAARVRFFRPVSDVSTTNGPIDVTAFVARFRDATGASHVLGADVAARETRPGEHAVSTGPLGDEAHADEVTVADQRETTLVQYTVEWRQGNLLNVMVVRGRYGGARITDAVALAGGQVDRELGSVTPPPTGTATATAGPSPTVTAPP